MDTSYISVLIFLITTILFYLVLKPKMKLDTLNDAALMGKYATSKYMGLGIYLLLVVMTQFAVNAFYVINTCGGSSTSNIGYAFIVTFIPWIFIFGILMAVLIIFPGIKSAFSNVVGYFIVASTANGVLTELLVNTDLNRTIKDDPSLSPEQKLSYQTAADAIIKLCGNMSILINQIVPENFNKIWTSILTPLMKDQYQPTISNGVPIENQNALGLKQKLLDVVVLRDNIGEGMWFLYTAILLTSIVQYKITSRGCVQNLQDIQQNQQDYLKKQAVKTAANAKAKNMVYTKST
uniref:Uncharacterized protein n=1 Tax=viral metagenome TaxID=1070528 RepID=A0A6C0CVT3_9ZZZZ